MNPLTNDLIRGAELIVGDRKAQRIKERQNRRAEEAALFADEQRRLGNQGTQAYMPDTDLLDKAVVDPFGEMQDELQTYRADDRGFTEDEETGVVRRETFEELRGEPVTMAPKSAVVDALAQLQRGTAQYGYDAFPGAANVEGRLEDALTPNRAAEASLVSEMVRRDQANQNPLRQAYSNIAAQIEAEAMLRGDMSRSGMETLERTGQIAQLGNSGALKGEETSKFLVQDPIMGYADTRLTPGETVYTDPRTGAPIASQGPEIPAHMLMQSAAPNNMGSRDQLNAPMSATDWAIARQPNFRSSESGSSFGDYPQVDITLETTNMANKLKELSQNPVYSGMPQVGSNIRSLGEYEEVVNYIVNQAQQNRIPLRVRGEEGASQPRPSINPGAAEVANLLLKTSGDEERFANALVQLEVAKQRGLNEQQSGAYAQRTPLQGPSPLGAPQVEYDAAEALNNKAGAAPLAQIPKGSKIGVREAGANRPKGSPQTKGLKDLSIVAELKKRGEKPFIGAVRGEVKPTGRGMYSGRDEIATRENSMRQILENAGKREAKDRRENPMQIRRKKGREDDIYYDKVGDLRDKQVRTYVARKRAEEANRKRAEQADTIISSLPPTALRSIFPRGSR